MQTTTTIPPASPAESGQRAPRIPNGRSPRGPRGHWLWGVLPEVRRDRLAFFESAAREYGDFVPFRAGPSRGVLISHPDFIEDLLINQQPHFRKTPALRTNRLVFGNGLLVSEGSFWLRQRRLAQPAFHRQRLQGYGRVMAGFAERMLDGWSVGHSFDVHEALMHVTLEIVAKTLFDADVSGDARDVGQAMEVLTGSFLTRVDRLFQLLNELPTRENRLRKRAVDRLDAIVYRIVAERRKDGQDRGDLLSMLLAAQDDDGSGMTDQQLRDEAMTLFLAGHETTAIALSWTLYLLAQHPDVESRLVEELSGVLGGRTPTVEDLPSLPFTATVVTESMRLFPPAWTVGREAIEDCHIGGQRIPRGTMVFASQWVVQRDPRWYDEPLRFNPERWMDGLAQRLPRFAYFPFGGGQRMCIGNGFATMEANLLLATIMQRFHLELQPGQRVVPLPTITLRPKDGIKMAAYPREPLSLTPG